MSKLEGLRVLITRPAPQGELLCEKISAVGGHAIFFPTISIVPPPDKVFLQNELRRLEQIDWLIFISPQAVYQSKDYLNLLPSNLKIAAVGGGTAQALREASIPVHCYPKEDWRSEGLLNLAEFRNVTGKKIAIIKGEGGREILSHTLVERGASVISIVAYQRILPKVDSSPIINLLREKKIDVIVSTSVDGLQNLKTLFTTVWPYLCEVPLLVISERMLEKAHQLGFINVRLAKNASDSVLIEALAKEKSMTENKAENLHNTVRKPWPWRAIGILFSTLGVLALILLFYTTNFYYTKNFAKTSTVQTNTALLQSSIEDLKNQIHTLSEELKTQTEIVTALRQTQTGYTRDEWRIVEAEFLTKLANDKLQLENNISQAIMLLQSADAELRNLNDAKFLPIRKALAADIAKLQATPQIDVPGLYLRLAAVNEQISKLSLPNKPAQGNSLQASVDNKLPWWKRGLAQTWQVLSQIVTVRYHQKGTLPLLLPEQQDFLYQNLHAALEKAMWGLLHQQPDVYRKSLEQTTAWIKQYFVADSSVTQSILTTLTQLSAIDIHPAVPKLSDSLQAFQDYFSARGVQVETQSAAVN